MKREKYNDRNPFTEEKKQEENQQKNCNTEPESRQIKNANAAGMGALERSNENQIKTDNQVDREESEPVY
jgi:hypothetical protein